MNESVQKSRQTLLKSIALGLLLALAVTLRVQQIQSLSFWFDEACSWKISQLSWTETLDAVSRDAHPPLYYFLCKAWSSVFGTSVLAARSLSILFGIATILACLWFSREADIDRMNPRPNQERVRYSMSMLAVAMLVGLNAFQIELSQEARPYTLGAFLSVVSACFLLRAVRAKFSLADWSGFTIAVILLSFTHYYCLFTIGALYLFLGLEILLQWKTSRVEGIRLLKYSLVSAWFVQLAWLPWWSTFFNQLSRANRQLWMKPFAWDEFAKVCADSLGISETSGQSLVASYIAIGIWGVLSLAFLFSRERSHRLAGMCALAPLIMAMIYSISTRSIIGDRYLLFAQTFFLINLALLLRPYRYQRLATILVMGVFIWLMSWTIHDVSHRRYLAKFPGTKGAVKYLNNHREDDDVVVINSPFVHTIVLQYLDETAQVYTISAGDHRENILSGLALRESDLLPEEFFSSSPDTLWTIDTVGLFKRKSLTDVPLGYEVISEHRFAERFHFRMDHIVRKYKSSLIP